MQLKLPELHFLSIFSRRKLFFLGLGLTLIAVVLAGYLSGIQNIFYVSRAQVFIKDQKAVATFNIAPGDRTNLEKFSRNLGLEGDFSQGVEVGLDKQSINFLKSFLPAETTLRVRPKSIEFSSRMSPDLFGQTVEGKLLQSAAGEGGFKIEDRGGGRYEIEIDNPEQVLSSATASGKLKLSSEAIDSGLWQMLSKLAKIKVSVEGRTLQGVVVLR